MTQAEIETYLIVKYGSINNAHRAWLNAKCLSKFDDNIILTYIGFYLNKPVDKRR